MLHGVMAMAERDDSASEPYSDELNVTSPSILDTAEGGNIEHFSNSSSEVDDNQRSEDEISDTLDTNDAIKKRLSTVSFGVLVKAQSSLRDVESSSKRKRKRNDEKDQAAEEKLKALRDRLRELQNTKKDVGKKEKPNKEDINKTRSERPSESRVNGTSRRQQHENKSSDDDATSTGDGKSTPSSEAEIFGSENDHSSTEEDKSTSKKQRSSKHAPTELSSKRAVPRKRPVISVPKSTARDPRFDPLSGPLRHDTIAKKYAFLNEYQKSELAELKSTLKSNKKLSDADREALKKKIMSMESQQEAANAKEKEREILREHRKKEKEMVKRGKKPFYLKKSDVKKQALVKKFEGMKRKDRDKAIERRRRKLTAREKRNMPDVRRA